MEKPERPNVRSRINPKGKKVYFLDYVDPSTGKRKRSVIGPVKRDTEKKADQLYREMMAEYVGDANRSYKDISLKDLVELYFQTKMNRIAQSSVRRYRTFANNFLGYMTTEFSAINMASMLERRHVERFLKELSDKGKKPKTINNQIFLIKTIFDLAASEGYIRDNKLKNIQRVRDASQAEKVKYWTYDEVQLILEAVKPYWRDSLEFLYHTGIRKGELINLTWEDVNMDAEQPTIKIQAKDGWTPKTNQQRPIPLNAKAVEIIERQDHSVEHNYIFKGKYGGMIHRDKIYRCLKTTLNKLGLEGNVHKFRHTFASHLVMKGAGLETVSKLLGHSSIEMTMKYASLAPDHLRKAVDMLILE